MRVKKLEKKETSPGCCFITNGEQKMSLWKYLQMILIRMPV